MGKVEQMTVEELQAALTDLHGQGKAIKAKKRQIAEELEARAAKAEVERALAGLSPRARAVIGPVGIPSGGAVGMPGAG